MAPNGSKWVFGIIRTFLLSSPQLLGRFHPQLLYSRPCDRACHGAKWVVWGCHLSLTNDGTFWLILLLDVFFFFLGGMFLNVFFFAIAQIKRACVKYKLYMLAAWCCDVGNTKTSSTSYKVTRIWPPWRNANSLGLGRTAVRSTCPTPQQKNLWRQRHGFLKLNT